MKRLVSVALAATFGLALGVFASPIAGASPTHSALVTWQVTQDKAKAGGLYEGDKIGGRALGVLTAPKDDCWSWTTVTFKDGEPGEPWHSKTTCESNGLVPLNSPVSKDSANGTILLICGAVCRPVCPQDGGECKLDEQPVRDALRAVTPHGNA